MSEAITEVAEVVRTSVAPVFLLSGVGVTLTMLTGRLARVVDRARALERSEIDTLDTDMQDLHQRVETLAQRARLLGRAITLCTFSALFVSVVVVALFVGAFVNFHLSLVVSILFVLSMFCYIGGLLLFLREVFVATRSLRIGLRGARLPGNLL
jgi:Protein of unknown function (DUF2721)